MIETERVSAWLYGKLRADTTLNNLIAGRIYVSGMVPTNPKFPYIRYHLHDQTDILALGPQRPGVSCVYFVGSVMQLPAASDPSKDIMDRVDALLRAAINEISGGLVINCWRTKVMRPTPDMVSGNYFPELQTLFQVDAQEVP